MEPMIAILSGWAQAACGGSVAADSVAGASVAGAAVAGAAVAGGSVAATGGAHEANNNPRTSKIYSPVFFIVISFCESPYIFRVKESATENLCLVFIR